MGSKLASDSTPGRKIKYFIDYGTYTFGVPVFLQKENSIKGHFLICYLAVLLERIFQFKILDNQYSTHQIMKFIRSFKVVKGESKYINVTASSEFIKEFEKITNLPLTNYYLTERQIRQIFNYKI